MTAPVFRFDLTRAEVISANDRPHRHEKARLTAALRAKGAKKARDTGIILRRPVVLRVRIGWPDARKRDRLNLAPTTKALIDGIAPLVLGNDSDDRIVEERWTSAVTRNGCIEVALTFEETGICNDYCPFESCNTCDYRPEASA